MAGDRPERDAAAFKTLFQEVDVNVEPVLLPYFHYDSGSGEISVISYVMQNQSYSCCVIDEEFGRKICQLFGIPLTGSIGIILEMRRMGLLSSKDIRSLRGRIKASNFYLTTQLLDQLQ
jgi:predicted nucleic acid-binding protein